MAEAPRFEIPEDAYRAKAHCSIEKSTRKARGNGWSDWLNEKEHETFLFTFWSTEESVNTLEDRGSQIKFTRIKHLSDNDLEIRRHEVVEDWSYRNNNWQMKAHLLDITILRRKGSPNLWIERWDDGRVFQWEASAAPNGAITKNLLNPEVLNTKERQFGLFRTVCRH